MATTNIPTPNRFSRSVLRDRKPLMAELFRKSHLTLPTLRITFVKDKEVDLGKDFDDLKFYGSKNRITRIRKALHLLGLKKAADVKTLSEDHLIGIWGFGLECLLHFRAWAEDRQLGFKVTSFNNQPALQKYVAKVKVEAKEKRDQTEL
jgi:hypothetical protein